MMLLLLLFLSFALGSIPSGFVVGKFFGVDVREKGSGNIGATNVSRVVGKKAGFIVLIFDVFKGAIPVCLPTWLLTGGEVQVANAGALSGLMAILGHCYSPALNFRGGKGVATSLGVFFSLAPWPTLIALGFFLPIVKVTRYVALGSIVAALSLPPLIFFWYQLPLSSILLWCSTGVSGLVVYKHRENIARLRAGTEKKWQ